MILLDLVCLFVPQGLERDTSRGCDVRSEVFYLSDFKMIDGGDIRAKMTEMDKHGNVC
jgi:hypothetical protein